jgi:hypothetical protein
MREIFGSGPALGDAVSRVAGCGSVQLDAPRRGSAGPLAQFPTEVGGWRLVQEGVVDEEVRNILKADDLLSREYGSPDDAARASLLIAAFQSQRKWQDSAVAQELPAGQRLYTACSWRVSDRLRGRRY